MTIKDEKEQFHLLPYAGKKEAKSVMLSKEALFISQSAFFEYFSFLLWPSKRKNTALKGLKCCRSKRECFTV